MPYFVRDATKQDAPAMAAVFLESRSSERDLFAKCFTLTHEELAKTAMDQREDYRWKLESIERASVVGMGEWIRPGSDLSAGKEADWPISLNRDAWKDLSEKEAGIIKDNLGAEASNMWGLISAATHSDYRGKGVAGLVLQWGQEAAYAEGKKIYLFANETEYVEYEDVQFEERGSAEILGEDRYLMVWEPSDRMDDCRFGGD